MELGIDGLGPGTKQSQETQNESNRATKQFKAEGIKTTGHAFEKQGRHTACNATKQNQP